MTIAAPGSHEVVSNGDKVTIRRVELFMAFDPAIDNGDTDPELKKFDNERLRSIVQHTRKHIARGSYPRVVVMHEKDGKEPKSAVGRIPALNYEERNGVGYIVGDMEMGRDIFDKLIASNAFPRRSAEIWSESDHLSEIALLGRETPRRPLPDTHFAHSGEKIVFSKSNHDLAGVGGGLNTFVPAEIKEEASMASDEIRKEMEAMKYAISELADMMKKKFADPADEKVTAEAEEEADVHIDIGSHDAEAPGSEADIEAPEAVEEEDAEEEVIAMRETYSLRAENARLKARFARLESEMKREKFSREIDQMAAEGYRIPEAQRDNLIAQLDAARDPVALLESWRDLFSRDPIGTKIDMSRASLPKGGESVDVASLVREFAGKPTEFAKAINSRVKR